MDASTFAFTRARHIQRHEVVAVEPATQGFRPHRALARLGLNDQAWLAEFFRKLPSFQRAAIQGAEIDDQCPIAVDYVLSGALPIAAARQFCDLIPIGDAPILGQTANRTPSAMRNFLLNGPVQRGSVGTGLTS